MPLFLSQKSFQQAIQEAERKAYERGCLDGYRNCEDRNREHFRLAMKIYEEEVRTGKRKVGQNTN